MNPVDPVCLALADWTDGIVVMQKAVPMTGSIVLVMLIGWLACICFMILLSSRKSETLTRRTTGRPASPASPIADSGDR